MAQPQNRDATPEMIDGAALILGLSVPDACHAGVAANLALLKTHFAIVAAVAPEENPAK